MQVHGSYFYLPARQPENSLYGVLVAIQEVRTIRYPKSISCLICRWKRPCTTGCLCEVDDKSSVWTARAPCAPG